MGGTNGESPDEISLWRVMAQMLTHATGNLTTIIVLLSCSPQNSLFSADVGGNKVQEWELAWIWMHRTFSAIYLLDISRNGWGIAASPVPEPGARWKNEDRSRYKNIYQGNQVQRCPAQPVWGLQKEKSLVKQLLLKPIPFSRLLLEVTTVCHQVWVEHDLCGLAASVKNLLGGLRVQVGSLNKLRQEEYRRRCLVKDSPRNYRFYVLWIFFFSELKTSQKDWIDLIANKISQNGREWSGMEFYRI